MKNQDFVFKFNEKLSFPVKASTEGGEEVCIINKKDMDSLSTEVSKLPDMGKVLIIIFLSVLVVPILCLFFIFNNTGDNQRDLISSNAAVLNERIGTLELRLSAYEASAINQRDILHKALASRISKITSAVPAGEKYVIYREGHQETITPIVSSLSRDQD